MNALHVGRSWPGIGNPLEATCPCPKEPCGLVALDRAVPECTQHPTIRHKTMRQIHEADACLGAHWKELAEVEDAHDDDAQDAPTLNVTTVSLREALESWDGDALVTKAHVESLLSHIMISATSDPLPRSKNE